MDDMKTLVLTAAISIVPGFIVPGSSHAQIADVSVGIVEHFADTRVRIVDHFEDERWQVVGECSSIPTLEIEIVEHFEDLRVKIVDHFPDQQICITQADRLDEDMRRMLHLDD